MTDWRPYHDPWNPNPSDSPVFHDRLEIRDARTGETWVQNRADMHPAMNVANIEWRPVGPAVGSPPAVPQTTNVVDEDYIDRLCIRYPSAATMIVRQWEEAKAEFARCRAFAEKE